MSKTNAITRLMCGCGHTQREIGSVTKEALCQWRYINTSNWISVQYGSRHGAFKIQTFITLLSNNFNQFNFNQNYRACFVFNCIASKEVYFVTVIWFMWFKNILTQDLILRFLISEFLKVKKLFVPWREQAWFFNPEGCQGWWKQLSTNGIVAFSIHIL